MSYLLNKPVRNKLKLQNNLPHIQIGIKVAYLVESCHLSNYLEM